MEIEEKAWRATLTSGRALFRSYPEISASFKNLKDHSLEFIGRANEFDFIIGKINYDLMFGRVGLINPAFRQLKQELVTGPDRRNRSLLPEVEHLYVNKKYFRGGTWGGALDGAFQDVKKDFPEWAEKKFERETSSAAGILLEGYGTLLGKIYADRDVEKEKRIKRFFVLAFETEMLLSSRSFKLLQDLAPWIKEEIVDFPEELHGKIKSL
jgi:hypothetical protein